MRELYTLAIGLFFSVQAFCCVVETGDFIAQKYGDVYKIFLSQQPRNTCFRHDSSSLQVTILCKSGEQEVRQIGVADTLYYQITADATLAASVVWWNNGTPKSRTDIANQCIEVEGNGLCFKHLETIQAETVPEMSTENPPPIEFGIEFLNELIVKAPWPGELRVFDHMGQVVLIEAFDKGIFIFDCEALPPGLFYLNVLLFRPSQEGGLISETLQIWH